ALPFPGTSSGEVLRKILNDPAPLPTRLNADVPRDLQTIVMKAMEKDPGHRYANASEMAEDLRRFLRFDPIHARMPGPITLRVRALKRNRFTIAAGAAVLLICVMLIAWERRRSSLRLLEEMTLDAQRLEDSGSDSEPKPWRAAQSSWNRILENFGDGAPQA